MIDINKLRRLALDGDLCAVQELLDRLEAAEQTAQDCLRIDREKAQIAQRLEAADRAWKEADKSCRDLTEKVIPNIREQLESAEKERDAMRARLDAMERQEPVAWMLNCQTLGGDTGWILSWTQSGAGLCNRLQGEENEKKLYALPGAHGEGK